jgi:serine/threonine-protein kinase
MPVGAPAVPERYRELQLVARGGMGEVYRATDAVLGREVAIKLLDERYASDDLVRKRFTREAHMAARVSSEAGIVTIFDVGECEGRPFIVMEYLSGGSLQDVLTADGAQPPRRAIEWLEDAAGALDRAHEHGIVHRDVKPANLLLDGERRVHVADFGVASAAGLDSLTQVGTVIGTAGYLSPEQAEGKPATPASDRYALGIVAFELLAGSRPFQRSSTTAEALAHVSSPVPSLAERRAGLPPAVDAVIERALAKNPADRFPTCRSLVRALERALVETKTAPTQVTHVLPPARRPRRLLPIVVLLVALAAIGAVAGVLIASNRGSTPVRGAVTITRKGSTVVRTVTSPPSTTASTSTTRSTTSTTTTTTASTTAASTTTASTTTASTTTASTTTTAASSVRGTAAAAQGFAKMRAGDYAGALPSLEQAAHDLQGSGSLSEAYNDYNLAYSLAKTQGCSGRVIALLDASQRIQGRRSPIDELRRSCQGQGG